MASQRFLRAAAAIGLAMAAGAGEALAQQNSMPFSQTYRRPSVSPYTMLATSGNAAFSQNGTAVAGTFNPLVYQQLIQPREEQERSMVYQMQQSRQINNLQNRVQQIQRDTTARQVNEQIRATGHMSTYQNLSHFYPGSR